MGGPHLRRPEADLKPEMLLFNDNLSFAAEIEVFCGQFPTPDSLWINMIFYLKQSFMIGHGIHQNAITALMALSQPLPRPPLITRFFAPVQKLDDLKSTSLGVVLIGIGLAVFPGIGAVTLAGAPLF